MIKKLSIFIISLSLMLVVAGNSSKAHAMSVFNPFSTVCDGSPESSSSNFCQERDSNKNPLSGPDAIIPKVANIIAVAGGIIAVIVIILSGLKMVTSSGDSKKVTEARNGIIYSAIGIVIIALSRLIIQFILKFA